MANTFQEVFIDCKRNIQIPLLQRDYVQGGRESVIVPFLEQLVSAVLNEDCTVNLNYIYGYEGEDGFIPIDGQQRLITLWLLHLYIYSQRSLIFPVDLKFESREFADAFSKKLKEKLTDLLRLDPEKLKDCIVDSPWFVAGWLYDATVLNMLETLNRIHVILGGTISTDINTKNISFDFLNMKDVGLDDDVYVKMNGRGRPLSYFENLKSWMDEQVKKLFGEDYQFTKDWRTKMDNDWSELFWNNRNTEQEHPEEIDDEQLRFFYSMLLLYWKQNDSDFCSNESDETKRKVIKALQECQELISLYQINKFALFNREVFQFISEGLEVLREISKYVNKLDERITRILGFDSSETTLLYKIALKEASYEKTIPLLFALVKTPKAYRGRNLFRWFRLWRNLILNSTINSENIANVCRTIDIIAKKVSDTSDLYKVFSGFKYEKGAGFSEEQLLEEVAKAKKLYENGAWEDSLIEAENNKYLKGKVWVLFQNDNNTNLELFVQRLSLLNCVIENQDEYYLPKILISYYDRETPETAIELKKSENNWKILLTVKGKGLFSCYRKIQSNMINPEIKNQWIKDLATTQLLNNSRDNAKIIERYGENNVVLWGTPGRKRTTFGNEVWGNVVIGNYRTLLLEAGLELVNKNNVVPNTNFITGFDVNFKYDNHYFQWWGSPNKIELDVYLMYKNEDEELDYVQKTNTTIQKGNDEDKYFCFRVDSQMTTTVFIEKLKGLIASAQNG